METPMKCDSLQDRASLRNGVRMPILGLGTSHSGGYCHSTVVYALRDCGYRLVDTAKRYGCEHYLGQAIAESGVPREDLFVATKLWPRDYAGAGGAGPRCALRASMERLAVDYLDLYLMHWPECPSECGDRQRTLDETWRQLELLHDEGLCRAVGVSNYERDDLERLLEACSLAPHVNQGYSPLAKGRLLANHVVCRVAQRHRRSAAQVLVRWSLQRGVLAIPKSTRRERVRENAQVFDFELSPEDMAALETLNCGQRYIERAGVQEKIDSPLPDGYKLAGRLSLRNYS
ncbi:putative oxidoreductase ZK1290.5 isoform X2 [Amblyomma americanum]